MQSSRILFHNDTAERILDGNHTATIRYKTYDADEVEVGDIASAILPNGGVFAALRITRTAVLPAVEALDLIAAFGEQYPSESAEQLLERVNRYYEAEMTTDSLVRVITFEKVASEGVDPSDGKPTLEDYKKRLRYRLTPSS